MSMPSGCAADLIAGHRSDIRNIPTNPAERFHHRDDEDDEEREMDERRDQSPEHNEQSAKCRDRAENREDNSRDDVEHDPGAAEDDRLHGVEAHKAVVL